MTEQLISFETAVLAKEKGFIMFTPNTKSASINNRNHKDEHYSFYQDARNCDYEEDLKHLKVLQLKEKIGTNSSEIYTLLIEYGVIKGTLSSGMKAYSAPTQSLLQKWLREKYGLHIQILEYNKDGSLIIEILRDKIEIFRKMTNFNLVEYEQALEKGLYEALKLI